MPTGESRRRRTLAPHSHRAQRPRTVPVVALARSRRRSHPRLPRSQIARSRPRPDEPRQPRTHRPATLASAAVRAKATICRHFSRQVALLDGTANVSRSGKEGPVAAISITCPTSGQTRQHGHDDGTGVLPSIGADRQHGAVPALPYDTHLAEVRGDLRLTREPASPDPRLQRMTPSHPGIPESRRTTQLAPSEIAGYWRQLVRVPSAKPASTNTVSEASRPSSSSIAKSMPRKVCTEGLLVERVASRGIFESPSEPRPTVMLLNRCRPGQDRTSRYSGLDGIDRSEEGVWSRQPTAAMYAATTSPG